MLQKLVRAWVACPVAAFAWAAAQAQTPSATPSPLTTTQTLAGPSDPCPENYSPDKSHGAMKIQPNSRWQPVGGEVRFALTGMEKPPENVTVYFAWETGRTATGCKQSQRVKLLPRTANADDTTYVYSALVPSLEDSSWSVEGMLHRNFATSTLPIADVYVHGSVLLTKGEVKGEVPFILMDGLGVSSPGLDYVVVFMLSGLAFFLLSRWAGKCNILGGWMLRVIATPKGVASLSQFQIFLWTAVIGAGVVWVMMRSGYLIEIPIATLGVLGISGFSLVGAKLQAGADGTPQRVNPPGAVSNLRVVGTPTSNTVVLSWEPPSGTPQPFSYTIQKRLNSGGLWETVKSEVGGPPFAVIDLAAATSYDFQVFAMSAGGAGPASVPVTQPTAVAPAVGAGGAGAPSQVTGSQATAVDSGSIRLNWANPAPMPDSYLVQFRKRDTLAWATRSTNAIGETLIDRLDPDTVYEFQVFAVACGIHSSPSTLRSEKTSRRVPQWADLVISGGDNLQVDLARLQMLVFTSIAAVFTALMVINTGEIPDIPIGELALVGVSNGVYLASKKAGP